MVESLPVDIKTILVEEILDSLPPSQKEIDELWKVEVERRIEEAETGKTMAKSDFTCGSCRRVKGSTWRGEPTEAFKCIEHNLICRNCAPFKGILSRRRVCLVTGRAKWTHAVRVLGLKKAIFTWLFVCFLA